MKVLSIGNSFSQDAQRYLHQIASSDGFSIEAYNLYIGGCPLSRHYQNMISNDAAYSLEINGKSTGTFISVKDALLMEEWDVITLQQLSSEAPRFETYEPYLTELAGFVRKLAPKAKIAIHQTWAYEKDSERLMKELSYKTPDDMLSDIKEAYEKAAKAINADFIIPSGEVFGRMIKNGIEKVHRDTFHASFGLGRYALGLTWYKALTGNDVAKNTFSDFDEEVTGEEIEIAKQSVGEV